MTSTVVYINGVDHAWYDTEYVSYEDLVRAAFPESPVIDWLVTWRVDEGSTVYHGQLEPGETLLITDDMKIDVVDLGRT